MASLAGWRALRADGGVRESAGDGGLADPLVCEAVVRVDAGALRVKVRPELGEMLRVFRRRSLEMGAGKPSDVVVIEVTPDPDHPERVVQLCIGNEIVLDTTGRPFVGG